MTEQKQTTAERIAEDMGVPLGAAQTIAAEIDALTAQLSSADRSREATEDRLNRLESALAGAGIYPMSGDYAAAVYALHGDVIAMRSALDRAVGERDEAQRIIGIYNTSRDEVIAQLCEMNDALRDERDEARAEVERLRPAAEAWEAQRRYAAMFADNLRGRVSDVDLACLESEYEAAAARAAAKESQP